VVVHGRFPTSANETTGLGPIAEGMSNQAIGLPESADQNPNG